jgi:ribonuclease VapC
VNRVVLDASAFLAFVNNETGAAAVAASISNCQMSSVNAAEIIGVLVRSGVPREHAATHVRRSGLRVESFDLAQAEDAGAMTSATAGLGLSLGDRACLALALRDRLEVLTADSAWAKLKLPLQVRTIR